MVVADHAPSIVVLTSSTNHIPPWVEDLADEVDSAISTATLTTIHDHLALDMPDALILTAYDDESLDCLEMLQDEYPSRPAVILCTDHTPDERFDHLVDLVIPPIHHPVLSYQVQQTIRQNKRHNAMRNELVELRNHQDEYERAITDIKELKDTIVHNVSHELNTPLLQVKSAVAMIAEDIKNNRRVNYARRATARLEAAVKNITQLAASLNTMQMSPLLIGDIMDSALRELRRTWEHEEHFDRIQVTLDKNLPPALGDRHGISIVLQQLIDNALKFSEDEVEVKASLRQGNIRISIRDYGIGIDKDELKKIFDSFYRVDPKATRNFIGTGVGLANVRLILERHGVEIEVKTAKGKGSTFSFELPRANLEK